MYPCSLFIKMYRLFSRATEYTLCRSPPQIICQVDTVVCHKRRYAGTIRTNGAIGRYRWTTSGTPTLTCWRGARHRDRGGGHRAGIGKGAHLGTEIEFRPRCLGAHADVLLMRFATTQHDVHLRQIADLGSVRSLNGRARRTLTLLPKIRARSRVTVSCVWQKKMMYSKSGLAGDCRKSLNKWE